MLLSTLNLPTTIDTSTADMAADFYAPALSVSLRYDRGVGFFSSGWLRMVAQGLLPFATNGGRARIITSPILDAADWEALEKGILADRFTAEEKLKEQQRLLGDFAHSLRVTKYHE